MTTTLPDIRSHFQILVEQASLFAMSVVLLAACSPIPAPAPSPAALSCAVGDSALVRETLYFGRNRPGGTVSDRDWNSFLADVVTPRFPQGLTVADAMGQWKGAGGETVEQERSEVVTLFHADNEAARRSVQEIALEYKRRFQQEAVLREIEPTCVRFE